MHKVHQEPENALLWRDASEEFERRYSGRFKEWRQSSLLQTEIVNLQRLRLGLCLVDKLKSLQPILGIKSGVNMVSAVLAASNFTTLSNSKLFPKSFHFPGHVDTMYSSSLINTQYTWTVNLLNNLGLDAR